MKLWRRRPREVDLHVPMLRIEDLFEDPHPDPFAPDQADYDPRPGLAIMVNAVQQATKKAPVRVTVELPPESVTPDLEDRARRAMGRECRRRLAVLDDELASSRRMGIRTLLWGLLAVIVLNGLVGAIGTTEGGTVEDAVSSGLQVAVWVALWFPVNLLVYDRWYIVRDRRAYAKLRDVPLRVVPRSPAEAGTHSAP